MAKMTKIMYEAFTKKGKKGDGQTGNESESMFDVNKFKKMTDTLLGSVSNPSGQNAETDSKPDFGSQNADYRSDDTVRNVKEDASVGSNSSGPEGINPSDNKPNADFNRPEEMKPKMEHNQPQTKYSANDGKAQNENGNRSSFEKEIGINQSPEGKNPKSTKAYDDPDFIQSASYKEIMSMGNTYDNNKEKKNQTEKMNETFRENKTSGQSANQQVKRDAPPMQNMLREELQKKFGPNWKQRIPPFLNNPGMASNIPDLGLGLDKAGNRDMVIQMSKVLKDIL